MKLSHGHAQVTRVTVEGVVVEHAVGDIEALPFETLSQEVQLAVGDAPLGLVGGDHKAGVLGRVRQELTRDEPIEDRLAKLLSPGPGERALSARQAHDRETPVFFFYLRAADGDRRGRRGAPAAQGLRLRPEHEHEHRDEHPEDEVDEQVLGARS